jgi:hypothetical protein
MPPPAPPLLDHQTGQRVLAVAKANIPFSIIPNTNSNQTPWMEAL